MERRAVCILAGAGFATSSAVASIRQHPARAHVSAPPPGIARVWGEPGQLTPTQIYFGPGSRYKSPLARLPSPPFQNPEKKTSGLSPKIRVRDSAGVHWTVKFGPEARADVAAPRLAWALGFGAMEGYVVESGRIEGVTSYTDLGGAKGWIDHDGTFTSCARFKRSDKNNVEIEDARGHDLNWNPAKNPGVPPEQLSGLLMFDALVRNWDAYPVNYKVLRRPTASGSENWFVVSDMGASFADKKPRKFDLESFRKTHFVDEVSNSFVILDYDAPSPGPEKAHRKIPLGHARWFRQRLERLTDEQIRACFDAAYATPGLNQAYASGDPAEIASARARELSGDAQRQIDGFTDAIRARITEFMEKVAP